MMEVDVETENALLENGLNNTFLLIDDDPVNNLISKITIEIVTGKASIKSFTDAREALEFIEQYGHTGNSLSKTILFLDLNMPVMSGWEFLAKFDFLHNQIKDKFQLYILSSSVDDRDKQRSYSNRNVRTFITKPLNKEIVSQILEGNL